MATQKVNLTYLHSQGVVIKVDRETPDGFNASYLATVEPLIGEE